MSAENQNPQEGGGDKVAKNFEKNIKKLVAIVGGEQNLRPVSKIKKDTMSEIVAELFKEEHIEVEAKTKESLKSLLKANVTMNREIAAKQKELDQLKVTKMKEFSEAATKLFSQISGLDELENEYYSALTEAANAAAEEETPTDDKK
jgi:hypothetical protein